MQGQFWGKSSQFVFTRAAAMALRQEDDPMDESAAREADESEGICKLARQLYWSDDLAVRASSIIWQDPRLSNFRRI